MRNSRMNIYSIHIPEMNLIFGLSILFFLFTIDLSSYNKEEIYLQALLFCKKIVGTEAPLLELY